MKENKHNMKRILFTVMLAGFLAACNNSTEDSTGSDTTNVQSTTPPPKKDTNPIGIMMGDTTIGINDSLKKDSVKN
jgi:hypothetical protein